MKRHDWWKLGGNLYRCHACGMDRKALPFIGLWRPWVPMCQG